MHKTAKWLLIAVALAIPVLDHFGILGRLEWLNINYNQFIIILLASIAAFSFTSADEIDEHVKGIRDAIAESRDGIISAVGGVEVTHFDDSDKAFLALEKLIRESKKTIDQASFAETPPIPSEQLAGYLDVIRKVAADRSILYRYAYGDNWPERGIRLGQIAENSQKFYLGELVIGSTPTVPMLNFAIFDGEVVYMRYPNEKGGRENYIIVRNPAVARLFSSYFETIWSSANKL